MCKAFALLGLLFICLAISACGGGTKTVTVTNATGQQPDGHFAGPGSSLTSKQRTCLKNHGLNLPQPGQGGHFAPGTQEPDSPGRPGSDTTKKTAATSQPGKDGQDAAPTSGPGGHQQMPTSHHFDFTKVKKAFTACKISFPDMQGHHGWQHHDQASPGRPNSGAAAK